MVLNDGGGEGARCEHVGGGGAGVGGGDGSGGGGHGDVWGGGVWVFGCLCVELSWVEIELR